MTRATRLFQYWGKAGAGSDYHSLVFHQLDVAATGIALLEVLPRLRQQLSAISGLPEPLIKCWVGFFLAIHDLGKFSSAFQQLRMDLCPQSEPRYFYTIRHDTLGYIAWRRMFAYDDALLDRLAAWGEDESGDDDPLDLIDSWVQCVTGHHGQPPLHKPRTPLSEYFSERDKAAVREWVNIVADVFLPSPAVSIGGSLATAIGKSRDASWLVAGLCTLADWLGSNRDHFPFQATHMNAGEYLHEQALPRAREAIGASGLMPVATAEFAGAKQLFNYIEQPTPLQAACCKVQLEDAPQLHILEDVTGAGKTEAAFILLARLMSYGQADGAYIALPTMATANAMYERTAGVYRKLFRRKGQLPSLVLAHGSRRLDPRFNDSLIHPHQLAGESEYERGELDAQARCNAWLADNNKKALLAHLGVGTIDQALLGVLQSRHQCLRLLGLVGKVLLVDEVHASDDYMHTLLCQLLSMHSRAGGSAILLSATLPATMRNELIHAWGGQVDAQGEEANKPYPLLTSVVPARQPVYCPVSTRTSVRRALQFRLMNEVETVTHWVVKQAEQGRCVAWVRNTVNDAIEAWKALSSILGEDRVTLFHARFAMGDRLEIERGVLDAFGPNSTEADRCGKVVVATQVIEQSLDLDFDEMVSDLAPVDLLIQRAGRLKRHRRDCAGNRLGDEGRDDQRGKPCLHVLSPELVEAPGKEWVRRVLPGTAAVYRDHGRLWLTAHELARREVVAIPDDLRDLIESVYGGDVFENIPEALRASTQEAEGKAYGDRSVARLNAIKPAIGYRRHGGQWLDDSITPTRLGETVAKVRLAYWRIGAVTPVVEGGSEIWSLAECRIAERFLDSFPHYPEEVNAAIESEKHRWPKKLRKTPMLVLDVPGSEGGWSYSKKVGLQLPEKLHARS